MADGGITEAAILAAAAEGAAGTAAAGAGTAAALAGTGALAAEAGTAAAAGLTAAEAAAGAGTIGGLTAAETAAIAAPELAAGATAAEAAPVVASAVPEVTAPVFLGATETEPVAGGLLGSQALGPPTAAEAAANPGLLGSSALTPGQAALADPFAGNTMAGLADVAPNVTPYSANIPASVSNAGGNLFAGNTMNAPTGLFDKLGTWWSNASTGTKLKAAGSLLQGVGTAAKGAMPSTPQQGPRRTLQPGTTGKPSPAASQAMAAVIDAMLKRRDMYAGAQSGVPVAYRPRGLLG